MAEEMMTWEGPKARFDELVAAARERDEAHAMHAIDQTTIAELKHLLWDEAIPQRDEAMAVLRDAGLALSNTLLRFNHNGHEYYQCRACDGESPTKGHPTPEQIEHEETCILAHPLLIAAMKPEEGNDA